MKRFACCFGLVLAATLASGAGAPMESLTNSIGMKLVRIPAGSFVMGQADGGDFDERPVHRVSITRAFHMGATEVNNAQYEQFDPTHRALRGKQGFSKADDEAVIFVSWNEAQRFCEWLSRKEGKPYRLPTEAEWEHACRAGTTTAYHTGEALPDHYLKDKPDLRVGTTPPNAWGLFDMHGNVEEWCRDWYGPYEPGDQNDPVGRADGDFKVTRGGSHRTTAPFLRSANRLGTLPDNKHWLIGFRVVLGDPPATKPLEPPESPLWAKNVAQRRHSWSDGPEPKKPFFKGPRQYVKIPPNSNGPLFSRHNHQPAITACPNGDLLAIWYSTRTENGRELGVVAARLRHGSEEWEPASPFWDAPDRNDHGSALLWDGKETLFQFNGLSSDATWSRLALILRTSTDNGATWSKARIIHQEHGLHNQVIAGASMARDGSIFFACDAVPGGNGGSVVHISRDGGRTWEHPAYGRPDPRFENGATGAWIAGIHAGVVSLNDGRLLAFGRGDAIDKRMPRSISHDLGRNWTYSPSDFPSIGGGQRLVLMRLKEGPLFLASFGRDLSLQDAAGQSRKVKGLFGALSLDEGDTWPVQRLITDDFMAREVDGGGNTGKFTLGPDSAEPAGYMAGTQSPDGVIHLISSKQHYAFSIAWLRQPMPAATTGEKSP